MVFCTIIVVVMSNPIRRITLNLLCTIPCCAVQQIFCFCLFLFPATQFNRLFFSASPRGHVQISKLSIRNKLVLKMVFCTIIVVIMSNPIRRITLNLLCTVPCYAVQQMFFSASKDSQGDELDHLKPRFEILHQLMKMLVCTLIGVILLISKHLQKHKNSCTRKHLVGHKFTICRLPRGWTGPSETSVWNTSPLKVLFFTLIGVIILNSKHLQNHKKSP